VNVVKSFVVRILKTHIVVDLFSIMLFSIFAVGCSDDVILPSAGQLTEFENAGPLRPSVDMDRLVKANISGGPYHLVNGDVLELTMPAVLQVTTTDEYVDPKEVTPFIYRVSDIGSITLPIVDEIKVAGKTLAQIESSVIDTYYPAYTVTKPFVFTRVLEYKTARVSIAGAVNKPGIYSLRSDQMSLVALLMEAGGIVDEGAAVIRIVHRDEIVPGNEETIVETNRRAFESPARLNRTKPAESAARYPSFNQIEIQLAFQQPDMSSTIGRLIITYGRTILLAERLDITNQGQRLLMLDKLAQREPLVSITDVDQKLCALANLLQHAPGTYNGKNKIPGGNIGSSVKPDIRQGEEWALLEKVSPGEHQASDTNEEQSLWQPTTPLSPTQSMPNSEGTILNETIHSSLGLYSSYSGRNLSANETLGQELPQMYGLDNSRKITGTDNLQEPEVFVLPVKGLNVPFADVVLYDGDSVIVEPLQVPLFTVIGLVNTPGSFPYPSNMQYNLMQAISFAGGLDQDLEPRYAMVYRLKPDGEIVHATFRVAHASKPGSPPPYALTTRIKPGDIVAVEHTPRTRTTRFLESIFSVHVGAYVPVWK